MPYIISPQGTEEETITITDQEFTDIINANEDDDVVGIEDGLRDLVTRKHGKPHNIFFRIVSLSPLNMTWAILNGPSPEEFWGG